MNKNKAAHKPETAIESERTDKAEARLLPDLRAAGLDEIAAVVRQLEQPAYRAQQIFDWIQKGIRSFADMTNLPADLRRRLAEEAELTTLEALKIQISKIDQTRKYLFGLADGEAIESVYMEHSYGTSGCISSQVGCAMSCSFCASTQGGLVRQLSAAEMIEQVNAMERDTGQPISRIDVMGSGEPLLNYANLSRFLERMHDPRGRNMSYRAFTVSTCGIIPGIEALGRDFPQVNLAISLHAPNDVIRQQLMPINRSYPVKELLAVCKAHADRTGRQLTYEYILIAGVNNKSEHAAELANRLAGSLCHVNLIFLNPVTESGYKPSSMAAARVFTELLAKKGVSSTIRKSMGADIDGACGQLRRSSVTGHKDIK
ncbi:MAG TPA: 23S rRNA (adenine(2503)-C(2))-methyltransferase RlmN [Clostridiales bacterium]|jgi:23S rRNA (adenine2503-C2)-methyltransferase|nr:23S rRNA (adenine(2503)-C(2))-methyltransferase RlmN [Clostridiales bacterium]